MPTDIYIYLNNSGIDPEFLIKHFTEGGEEEEEEEETDQYEVINKFKLNLKENEHGNK